MAESEVKVEGRQLVKTLGERLLTAKPLQKVAGIWVCLISRCAGFKSPDCSIALVLILNKLPHPCYVGTTGAALWIREYERAYIRVYNIPS